MTLFPLSRQQLLERSNPPLFPGDLSGDGTPYRLRPCVCTGMLGWRRRWDGADYVAAIFVDPLVAFTLPQHVEDVEVKYERAACRLWLRSGPRAGIRVPNHTGLDRRQKMGFSIGSGVKVVLCSMC